MKLSKRLSEDVASYILIEINLFLKSENPIQNYDNFLIEYIQATNFKSKDNLIIETIETFSKETIENIQQKVKQPINETQFDDLKQAFLKHLERLKPISDTEQIRAISDTVRGFERIKNYPDVNLPKRATKHAAGYDFEAAETVTIQPFSTNPKPVLVPTGIKAFMANDEYLQLANRSSNPLKNQLMLANGIGVIDSDYYNNPDNEGHIMFQFINFGNKDITIQKGDRIGQGIFVKYLTVDDNEDGQERQGGFGSSGK